MRGGGADGRCGTNGPHLHHPQQLIRLGHEWSDGNARHSLMMRLRSRRRARAGEWARGPRRLIEHTCSPARGTQRPRAPRALDQPLTSARHRELERPRSAASKACDPPQIARQSSGQSGQRSLHKKSAGSPSEGQAPFRGKIFSRVFLQLSMYLRDKQSLAIARFLFLLRLKLSPYTTN